MKILLTGATGYIGKRLMLALLDQGHHLVCCVRDKSRFEMPEGFEDQIALLEVDFLQMESIPKLPQDVSHGYYLIHSMASTNDYSEAESKSAQNFCTMLEGLPVKQVIYLGGMTNADELSTHLASRKQVEDILSTGSFALTTLKAGIIIGSGSASFEIIRDLVEKLPVMIAPRWLKTRCQPIAIRNVMEFLVGVLNDDRYFNRSLDIGGADVLTYKDMLMQFAEVRKLPRYILTVPVMTPRLSSYWLYFVTSTSYRLATALVGSMKVEVVAKENTLAEDLGIKLLTYREALEVAFEKIEQNAIVSSWKDSLSSGKFKSNLTQYLQVPIHGCLIDHRKLKCKNVDETLDRIWSIGGDEGWYFANWLWRLRGAFDKLIGGVGLRRGRTHASEIHPGNALDFWRVLWADKDEKRLLLFAEMRLPGEAWLEFKIDKDDYLHQIATFRPRGVLGRLYWYGLVPFHHIIFRGMLRRLAKD